MSLDACLPDLERKGEIDVGRSKEARALYQELKTFYSPDARRRDGRGARVAKDVERLEAAAAHKNPQPHSPGAGASRRRSTRSAATMAAIRRAPGRSIPRAPKRCSASTAAPATTIRLTLATA
jgi:hypothetical protein